MTYNQRLSERRANRVKAYLQQHFAIAAARLDAEGKGYAQLADPAHPASAINRRVQVTNLGE